MHTLQEKKGNKEVTHYFDHVTEEDGTKKHVYLGTDPEQSKERLVKLQVERIRSESSLIKDMENLQAKLDKLGAYNRSYDDIISDIVKRHKKVKLADRMLAAVPRVAFPWQTMLIALSSVAFLSIAAYIFMEKPEITGAAVAGAAEIASNAVVATVFWIFLGVLLLGGLICAAEYRYKHRHDKYKPPETLDESD